MSSDTFLGSLKSVYTLRETIDAGIYTPLPDSWHVAVSDVRGSTDAIRLGRYKEVNMAGATVIAALSNAWNREGDLPYLFGGDGSLIAFPDSEVHLVKGLLAFCRDAVQTAYGLEMSVGTLPVSEIREKGHQIAVARLELSSHASQTIFWGSGVTWAEEKIKSMDLLKGVEPVEADFSGLECRWNSIPSQYDEVAAWIIQAVSGNPMERVEAYEECMERIEAIYGSEKEFHPIHMDAVEMTRKFSFLKVEWKLRSYPPTWSRKARFLFRMAFQYLTGLFLMRYGIKTEETDWGLYKSDLIRHCDYKKFGDGLRFVATGTVAQRMELVKWLEEQYAAGRIAFGVHPSFAAMVTCFVKQYHRKHIHFVDGADGGYAKASQELKERRSRLSDSTRMFDT